MELESSVFYHSISHWFNQSIHISCWPDFSPLSLLNPLLTWINLAEGSHDWEHVEFWKQALEAHRRPSHTSIFKKKKVKCLVREVVRCHWKKPTHTSREWKWWLKQICFWETASVQVKTHLAKRVQLCTGKVMTELLLKLRPRQVSCVLYLGAAISSLTLCCATGKIQTMHCKYQNL